MAAKTESPQATEALEARRRRQWFDRLIQLSDGVFAIAITLLAFDLHGPAVWDGRLSSLLADLAPKLDAYGLSFLVIAIYWLAHRRFMAMVHTVDAPVTVLTLVMLALVALLPAATQLVHVPGAEQTAMLVYGALVIAIGVTLAMIWGYAALAADLVSAEAPRSVRWFLLFLMLWTPPAFLLLVGLIPNPTPGEVPLSLAALFLIGWRMRMWVLRRLTRTPRAAPAGRQSARHASLGRRQ